MSETEIAGAYLEGKIPAWTFVRRLMKAGVSVGTAIAFTALLPAVAQSGDLAPLERLVEKAAKQNRDEAAVLDQVMKGVARGLVIIEGGGSEARLGRSLGRLGLTADRKDVNDANISFNGNVRGESVDIEGSLNLVFGDPCQDVSATRGSSEQNFALNLSGNVGDANVKLDGSIRVNVDGRRGPKGVLLNILGNVGTMPVNFNRPDDQCNVR